MVLDKRVSMFLRTRRPRANQIKNPSNSQKVVHKHWMITAGGRWTSLKILQEMSYVNNLKRSRLRGPMFGSLQHRLNENSKVNISKLVVR